MFIKLTRLDNNNTPIWINAASIVTLEPRKDGGTLVVPMGDGFDYDVRETPEEVLAMIEGAEKKPKGKAKKTKVKGEGEEVKVKVEGEGEEEKVKVEGEGEEAKVKKPKGRAKKVKVEDEAAITDPPAPITTPQTALIITRIRKMAPKTVRKLFNTLTVQFHVPDVQPLVAEMSARGILEIVDDRVIWKAEEES